MMTEAWSCVHVFHLWHKSRISPRAARYSRRFTVHKLRAAKRDQHLGLNSVYSLFLYLQSNTATNQTYPASFFHCILFRLYFRKTTVIEIP